MDPSHRHAPARQALLNMRDELDRLSQDNSESRRPVALDHTAIGRLSRMDAMQMQSMAQASERSRKNRKRQVTAALRRIETGEYGFCVRCGEEVEAKRLALDPAAALCVACAAGSGR